MLAQLLAQALGLLAAAAPGAPTTVPSPPNIVSGVTVQATPPTAIAAHPDAKVDMAGDDIIAPAYSFWPKGAFQIGTDGRVTLSCFIDVHGLAERCTVAGESPAGRGFGKAALQLRTTFKLPPVQGPGGPVGAIKTINVTFKAPDRNNDARDTLFGGNASLMTKDAQPDIKGRIQGNPLRMSDISMVNAPVWTAAPTFDDLARAYPARGGGVEGYVAEHCYVMRSGALNDCVPVKEDPVGHGFDKAALSLMSKFRLAPESLRGAHASRIGVDIPIRMPAPESAEIKDRDVMAPTWIYGVDPKKAPQVFPPEAADKGLTTGRGIVRCSVAPDGTLAACAPEPGEPDGLGFSEAAVKLAAAMKMNLWSADAAPVEGGTVHIPIRLNLKGAN